MEKLIAAKQAYELIKSGLDERLTGLGYLIAQQKADDPAFNSCFVIWSNNTQLMRVSWEGNESVFLVETSLDIPLTPLTKWKNISITTFNPAFENMDYIHSITIKVIRSIN